MTSVGFQVGDVVVLVDGVAPVAAPRGFLAAPDVAPSLRLAVAPFGDAIAGEVLLDDEGFAVLRTPTATVIELRVLEDGVARRVADVTIPDESSHGTLRFATGITSNLFDYSPLAEMLTLEILGRGRGVLVHGAAFAVGDRAYLLPGVSGAGKTTMSRRLADIPGVEILSDERVIARPLPGQAPYGWVVDGTPWPGEGEYTRQRTVPLHGVFLLTQSDHDAFLPVGAAQALGMLYRCHFRPFWRDDAQARTLDLLSRLVGDVPCTLLHNRLGGDMPQMLVDRLRA